MEKFVLTISDISKKELLLRFLNELNFVHVEEKKTEITAMEKKNFTKLYGLWKNRTTSLDDIRKKAWQRN
jgi:hypothetical protein